MSLLGARVVAAAAALWPLGLSLLVSPDEFVITAGSDDKATTVAVCTSIDEVEAFIADRRPAAAAHQVEASNAYVADTYGTADPPLPGTMTLEYRHPKPIEPRAPRVSDSVHYVSYGSPGGEYKSECRAAIVTEVPGDVENPQTLGLCVLNPAGMFFNRTVPYHEGDTGRDHTGAEIPVRSYRGGSWHHPGPGCP